MAVVLLGGPGLASLPSTLLLAAAYVALAVALLGGGLTRSLVLRLTVPVLGLALVRPPMQSHDVWSYVMYGRIVSTHHANPYIRAPGSFAGDPFIRRIDPMWRQTRSVYGPLFTGWSALITWVAGNHILLLRLGFQLTALATVLATAWLLDRRSGGDPRVLALVLLNPLVVFSLVNDAHVDAVVGLAVLAAVLLLERRRPAAAGAALAVGFLVKVFALLPAGAIGIWLLARRERWKWLAPYSLALVIVITAGLALGGGRTSLKPVADSSTRVSTTSVWAVPNRATTDAALRAGDPPATARSDATHRYSRVASVLVLLATIALALLWADEAVPIVAAGSAVLAYMVLGAYAYPWYVAAGLFAVALRPDALVTRLLVVHGALLQLAEVPGRQFPIFVGRSVRLPDPAWHLFIRTTVVPVADIVLIGVLVAAVVRRRLRRARGVPELVGDRRE